MRQSLNRLTRAAVIASLYIILTLLSNTLGLSSGVIQIRLSEVLTLLPVIFPESVWGLFVGCLIANIITGCVVWDIIFGSLASLLGAFLTLKLRRHLVAASLAPVLSNALVVPLILKYAYNLGNAWWVLCLCVALGELITCTLLAPVVIKKLEKHKINGGRKDY